MRQAFVILLFAGIIGACNSTKTQQLNPQVELSNSKTSTMNKKETALAFVKAVTNQDVAKVRALANPDYIQHNPFLPTGLEPFIGLFPVLKENGTTATAIRVA